jgi:hypothetical protein
MKQKGGNNHEHKKTNAEAQTKTAVIKMLKDTPSKWQHVAPETVVRPLGNPCQDILGYRG